MDKSLNVEKQEVQHSQHEAHMKFTSDKEVIETVTEGKALFDAIPKLEKPWYKYSHLLKLNCFLIAPILAQVVSGYDGSMMSGLQALTVWQTFFNNPDGQTLGTMSNGITIGVMITTPFSSYIVDYLGRKRSVILGCFVILIGAGLQGGAQNFGMFVGARILLGVGNCISSVAAGPWLTECAYPTQRAAVTGFLLASWSWGSFLAALVTWGSYNGTLVNSNWSWRIPSTLQGLLPLIQIAVAHFAPESPRWLISKQRNDEARRFFKKYHAGGDENSILVSYQMAEIEATLEVERVQKRAGWLQFFKTKAMRRRFFIVCIVPMMLQLEGGYGNYLHIILDNVGITTSVEQLKLNLGLKVVSLVMGIVAASFADHFRRRTYWLCGFIGLLVAYIPWTVLSGVYIETNYTKPGLAKGIIAVLFLTPLITATPPIIGTPYVMEVTPFALRAKASTVYQVAGNVAGFFNNYVAPIALLSIAWKYFIVWNIGIIWVDSHDLLFFSGDFRTFT